MPIKVGSPPIGQDIEQMRAGRKLLRKPKSSAAAQSTYSPRVNMEKAKVARLTLLPQDYYSQFDAALVLRLSLTFNSHAKTKLLRKDLYDARNTKRANGRRRRRRSSLRLLRMRRDLYFKRCLSNRQERRPI